MTRRAAARFGGILARVRVPLRSERLVLRPPLRGDGPPLVRLLADDAVHRWLLHMPHPYSLADARAFVARSRQRAREGIGLSLLIERRSDGQVIGEVSLDGIDAVHRHATVGYWLGVQFQGQGFGTEAVRRVCALAFGPLRLHRVSAYVFHPNRASQHLLRKVGFRREGRARDAFFRHGKFVDDVRFGLLSSEFDRSSRTPGRRPG